MTTGLLDASRAVRPAPATSLSAPERVRQGAEAASRHGVGFYLASNSAVHEVIGNKPFGIDLTRLDFMGPSSESWSVIDFLKLFNVANGLAFGPRGLPMPYWVMLDLALMPSAIVVATAERATLRQVIKERQLDESARRVLERIVDEADAMKHEGPIPVAGYCAAPTADRSRWAGWSLWSILPGLDLGFVVKGLALEAYGARYLDGTTQFDNPAIRIHASFGRLRLRSAALDIHTAAHSFVYECDLLAETSDDESPTFLLDPNDSTRQREMQQKIDAGTHEYYILRPGIASSGGRSYVPIREVVRI